MPYPDGSIYALIASDRAEIEAEQAYSRHIRAAEETLRPALALLLEFKTRWAGVPRLEHEDGGRLAYWPDDFSTMIDDEIAAVRDCMAACGVRETAP